MDKRNLIKPIVDQITPLSTQSLEAFLKLVRIEEIPQGTSFIKKDRPNSSEYFLVEGICRSYVPNENGDLVSISFFQDNSVITPHVIRTRENLSNLYFETLTNCVIGRVDAPAFLNLMVENLEVRNFANMVLKDELVDKVNKEIGMASLNAKDRLIELRKRYPNLENQIPHGMIASYLGITPISLSRLRKELSLN